MTPHPAVGSQHIALHKGRVEKFLRRAKRRVQDNSPLDNSPGQSPLPFWVGHFFSRTIPPNMLRIHTHTCMHTHTHTHNTYIHTYIYTHTYTYMHMHTYICMHTYTCIRGELSRGEMSGPQTPIGELEQQPQRKKTSRCQTPLPNIAQPQRACHVVHQLQPSLCPAASIRRLRPIEHARISVSSTHSPINTGTAIYRHILSTTVVPKL